MGVQEESLTAERIIDNINENRNFYYKKFIWNPLFLVIPFFFITSIVGYFYGVNGFCPVDSQGNCLNGVEKSILYSVGVIPLIIVVLNFLVFFVYFAVGHTAISRLNDGDTISRSNELEGLEDNNLAEEISHRHTASFARQIVLTFIICVVMFSAIMIRGYFVGVPGFFPEDINGNAISYDEKIAVYRVMVIPLALFIISILTLKIKSHRNKKRLDHLRDKNGR